MKRIFKAITFLGLISSTISPNALHAASSPLTIAWETAPRSIDPRYALDANSQYLENLVHCSLIDFDKNGATIGDLAKSWKWSDSKTLEITLHSKTKYSDGSILKPADVKATYDFFKNEKVKNPSPRKGAFTKLATVSTKGADTVIFHLSESDSTFVTNLVVGIMPAAKASGDMIDKASDLVGCGPFKLSESTITGLTLVPNSKFSLRSKPKSSKIVIKVVKDETTRFAKLRAGEVDIVQNGISRDSLDVIAKKNAGLKVVKRPGLNTAYLGFNMRDKIVGNVKVRQAIAAAIDKPKIIKYILKGLAIPAETLITPNDPFYNSNIIKRSHSIANAKKLLDEAGFKDPDGDGKKTRFELIYKTTTNTTRVALAKAIAADLRKVGIKVKVQPLEWGRFKSDVESGKVQMWSLKWVGFKDPDIFRYVFATESFPPNGGNRGWYSNKKLDSLMDMGKTQTDSGTRKKTYAEVQNLVSKELPYVFLWHEEIFAVMNKNVEGFELYADGRFASLVNTYKK
jgi:peptide/nickel transport system substrate-binding protein